MSYRLIIRATLRATLQATLWLLVVSLLWGQASAQNDPNSPASQDIQVDAFFSRTQMAFDDTLVLTVRLRWDKALFDLQEKTAPRLNLQRLRVGSVTSRTATPLSGAASAVSQEYVYTLLPTASGDGAAKPIRIGFLRKEDSKTGVVTTPELHVQISMPEQAKKEEKVDWNIVAGAGTLLLALLGVGLSVRRRKQKRLAAEAQVRREWDLLVERLEVLKRATSGSKAEFFDALYEFFYTLVNNAGFVSARKGDSDTVIAELNRAPLAEDIKRPIVKWLEQSAHEKFSPGRGTPGETLRVYYEVEAFMRERWPATGGSDKSASEDVS